LHYHKSAHFNESDIEGKGSAGIVPGNSAGTDHWKIYKKSFNRADTWFIDRIIYHVDAQAKKQIMEEQQEKVPVFKKWYHWYLLVILVLVVLIVLFDFFTKYFR
jgi:hypothetical protein